MRYEAHFTTHVTSEFMLGARISPAGRLAAGRLDNVPWQAEPGVVGPQADVAQGQSRLSRWGRLYLYLS
jgi:hypothetical protein